MYLQHILNFQHRLESVSLPIYVYIYAIHNHGLYIICIYMWQNYQLEV